MRPWKRVGAAALTFAAVAATAGGLGSAAFAQSATVSAGAEGGHAVFVETDNTAGNQVAAYARCWRQRCLHIRRRCSLSMVRQGVAWMLVGGLVG
jgi:hypothetical protein